MGALTVDERGRRVRRTALILFAVATVIYLTFIVMAIHKAHA